MTMKERLDIHSQIEEANEKNVLKWKVKKLYSDFVKGGQYEEAKMILRLLRRGLVKLYLDDASWNIQCAVEKIGCHVWYSRNGNTAEAYLQKART